MNYVKHISGQGKVFEIRGEGVQLWMVAETVQGYTDAFFCGLPKSEYVLCEPPARWVDVTAALVIPSETSDMNFMEYIERRHDSYAVLVNTLAGYRLRKVQGKALMATDSAFIVERKEQP